MSNYVIRHIKTGNTIFQGRFSSLRACIEQAIAEQISLDYADLAHASLVNANLDSGSFRYCSFQNANLMGANLSDAILDYSDFTNASLQNACLCFSSLKAANFDGALFGGTDIAGANISRARFSTLSALLLNFTDCEVMDYCTFQDSRSTSCPLSRPPLFITGLNAPLIVMDQHIKYGQKLYAMENVRALRNILYTFINGLNHVPQRNLT